MARTLVAFLIPVEPRYVEVDDGKTYARCWSSEFYIVILRGKLRIEVVHYGFEERGRAHGANPAEGMCIDCQHARIN
jgi:hypothetical protein